MKEEFSIIHLADLHISARDSINDFVNYEKWFKQLCNDITENITGINSENLFLIISGNITHSGSSEEFSKASVFLNMILDSTAIRRDHLLIVPGNHDLNWMTSLYKNKQSSELSAFFKFLNNLNPQKPMTIPSLQLFPENELAFITFDSTSKSKQSISIGYISTDQIRKIREELKSNDLNGYILVALLHHGFDQSLVGNHRIKNAIEFQHFLNEWCVNLILHSGGHIPGLSWSSYETTYGNYLSIASGTISPERWRSSFQCQQYHILKFIDNEKIEILTRTFNNDSSKWIDDLSAPLLRKIDFDTKRRPKLTLKYFAPKVQSKKEKNKLLTYLENLDSFELDELCNSLMPAIKMYNPTIETKSDFIFRLFNYFDSNNSLNILEDAINKCLSIDVFSKIKIFISSSLHDSMLAKNIANKLSRYDYSVWFHEDIIKPGDSISDKINQGFKNSDLVIILISENSMKSKWILEEINFAIRSKFAYRSQIIVVKISDIDLPTTLKNLKTIDISKSPELLINKVIDTVNKMKF